MGYVPAVHPGPHTSRRPTDQSVAVGVGLVPMRWEATQHYRDSADFTKRERALSRTSRCMGEEQHGPPKGLRSDIAMNAVCLQKSASNRASHPTTMVWIVGSQVIHGCLGTCPHKNVTLFASSPSLSSTAICSTGIKERVSLFAAIHTTFVPFPLYFLGRYVRATQSPC
jgi:hypothetical protein